MEIIHLQTVWTHLTIFIWSFSFSWTIIFQEFWLAIDWMFPYHVLSPLIDTSGYSYVIYNLLFLHRLEKQNILLFLFSLFLMISHNLRISCQYLFNATWQFILLDFIYHSWVYVIFLHTFLYIILLFLLDLLYCLVCTWY